MEAASLSFIPLSSPPLCSSFCCLPAFRFFDLFNKREHAEHTKHAFIVKMAYKTLAFVCKYVSVSIYRHTLANADFSQRSSCHLTDCMFVTRFRCFLFLENNLQNTFRHSLISAYCFFLIHSFRCCVLPFRLVFPSKKYNKIWTLFLLLGTVCFANFWPVMHSYD